MPIRHEKSVAGGHESRMISAEPLTAASAAPAGSIDMLNSHS